MDVFQNGTSYEKWSFKKSENMHFIYSSFKTLEKDQYGSSFLVKSQAYNSLTYILQIFTNSTFN